MRNATTCPLCGKPLPDGRTHGLCPACLMEQAMASRTFATDSEEKDLPAPPSPEEIADRFPQFEVVECLGRGGMGVVYKARQKSLDRWVAIKILHHPGSDEARFASHFEKEARTLARMTHPNIVTVFDHGEADGLYYIVMEFVDGVNLRDLLREGKMEPEQALAIVPPICEALEYAHDKGVVHRDIKPENLLLDREGRVKIADFGIASLVGATGEKSGTPPYMAPEQKDGIVDRRADIYALGAVLYEMLTGERPTKDLVAPSKRVEVDVKIDEMVLRALEKEPERRYQTAEEFRTVVQTMATVRAVGAASDKAGGPETTAPIHSTGAGWKVLRVFSVIGLSVTLLAIAGFVFLVGVAPYWQASWADQDRQLPGFQILLVNFSQFCLHFWPLVVVPLLLLAVGSAVGLVVAIRRLRRAAISEPNRVDAPLVTGKVQSENGEQTERRFFKHIRILSTSYQILGILLMVGAFILPIPVGLTLAQDKAAWNEIVPLMIATGFGCLLGLGFGGYFFYVGYALRNKHRYALGRVAAMILLVLSILTFPPLAALAIYTLVVLNKDAVAKAGESTIKPASTVGSKSKPHGMFGRLWWLFPGMLVLGPLVGAVAGLGVMKSMGVVQSTESTVIDVKGSKREIAATSARVTDDSTLDRVSAQLQLARAWHCQPAEVAPRLRRMIRVEPVADTTLIRLEVDHFNRAAAGPIADAIMEALVDHPEGPEISVLERAYSVPSKVRSAFPVLLSAVLGLVLSPFLALVVMTSLQRLFPEPQPRWRAAGVAGVLAIALLVTMGIGVELLGEIRTNGAPQIAPGPELTESPRSPEQAANSFMEAMRDGDIDAAMACAHPAVQDEQRLRKLLADASKDLRASAYGGHPERLTRFTEWHTESHGKETRFMAARIAAPTGEPDVKAMHGTYLVLTSTSEGWRVVRLAARLTPPSTEPGIQDPRTTYLHLNFMSEGWQRAAMRNFNDVGQGRSLSEYLDAYLQERVLAFPVKPPLAMPEQCPVTLDQVKDGLEWMEWARFLRFLSDRQGGTITAKEVPADGWNGRRYEVTFHLGTEKMLIDLLVDSEFKELTPTRLRRAADPTEGIDDASEFLPVLAYHYTIRIAKRSPGESLDSGVMPLVDVRTMERYVAALDVYVGARGSFPPDLEELIRDRSFLRKPQEDPDTLGRVGNYQTGTLEWPLYQVDAGMRPESLDSPKSIILAAPAPDRYGKRLVVTLGQRVLLIDEQDYLKQIAGQAKAAGPEQVARCFMEAIRSGDVDTTMVWLTQEMKKDGEARVSLEVLSKQLRDEIYATEPDKLTEFSETCVVKPDVERSFFAARVALPEGETARMIAPGLVLIVASTADGWRVAHFDAARTKRSLSDHVMVWSGQVSSDAEDPVVGGVVELMDVDERDAGPVVLDLASGKLLGVPKEVASEHDFNAHFNHLGKGDLAWDGAILTLRGARVSEWIDNGWTLRNPERENDGDGSGVYRIPVPTRLRITTAESEHFVVDVIEEIGNGKGVRIDVRRPSPSLRDGIVGKWQAPDEKTRIEFFADGTMAILDGSTKVGGHYTILDDGRVRTKITRFGTTAVETIQVSLSGDVLTTIDEKGRKQKLTRVRIEHPANPPETGKNDPEATKPPAAKSPPEGAEIQRFVLGLPVQPPVAVPKDSPLTIDQLKEVLEGVTWGQLLTSLGKDGQGDITVTPRPSPDGDRYEISFPYGTGRMRMDLAVDWKFRCAEPSRLRPVGMPHKILTESSEFLPQLVIRYAMKSGHAAAAPAVEEATAQARRYQDQKTLGQYATALAIYSEETSFYPPDLATFLLADFPGKKRWEGLLKDGLLHNHQTGKMGRPIYHGSEGLRANDHDVTRYILLAAPSADPQGKRLVSYLDASVRTIDEADYQKQVAAQAKSASVLSGSRSSLKGPAAASTFEELYRIAKLVHSSGDYVLRTRYTDYSGMPADKVSELKHLAANESHRREIGHTKASVLSIEQFEKESAGRNLQWGWNIRPQKVIVLDESHGDGGLSFVFGAFERDGKWRFSCAQPYFRHKHLKGVLKRTVKALSPYRLELDGTTDTIYLRGKSLEAIPDGTRIGVTGFIRSSRHDTSNDPTPTVMPSQRHIYMEVTRCKWLDDPADEAGLEAVPRTDFDPRTAFVLGTAFVPGTTVGPLRVPLGEAITIEGRPCAVGFGGAVKSQSMESISKHGLHSLDVQKVNGVELKEPVVISFTGNAQFEPASYYMIRGYQTVEVGPGNPDPDDPDATAPQGNDDFRFRFVADKDSTDKLQARNEADRGNEVRTDLETLKREFHFKVDRPHLLRRGTANYLVIPVAIQSEDHIIKTVDWSSRQVDGNEHQYIDLSLVLEPSAKGDATTTEVGKPRITGSAIVGINSGEACQIRYANPDGTFVDLMTVDTEKLKQKKVALDDADDGTQRKENTHE